MKKSVLKGLKSDTKPKTGAIVEGLKGSPLFRKAVTRKMRHNRLFSLWFMVRQMIVDTCALDTVEKREAFADRIMVMANYGFVTIYEIVADDGTLLGIIGTLPETNMFTSEKSLSIVCLICYARVTNDVLKSGLEKIVADAKKLKCDSITGSTENKQVVSIMQKCGFKTSIVGIKGL